MSEYQFYEFQAVDRPLTKDEMAELRALSTRATITPTRFQNVYNWGDFKGDPFALMERYFDAFVYVANWGTHHFMLRLPRRLLDPETVSRYGAEPGLEVHVSGDHVILEFLSQGEDGDWEGDGEGWLSSLLPLRADLAVGDLRSLYLGWLAGAASGALDGEAIEPPVPPGLGSLSASLKAFGEFLRVDDDLIAVAAERSAGVVEAPAAAELEAWIRQLPEAEKNACLLRLAIGGNPHLHAEIVARFRQAAASTGSMDSAAAPVGRTVEEIVTAAEERAEARRRQQVEREATERARRQQEEAAARAAYLDDLAKREEDVWQQVDRLVETKRPADYDQAARLLVDLCDLSTRKQTTRAFEARLSELRVRHARKPSFLARLDRAGLPRG